MDPIIVKGSCKKARTHVPRKSAQSRESNSIFKPRGSVGSYRLNTNHNVDWSYLFMVQYRNTVAVTANWCDRTMTGPSARVQQNYANDRR